MAQSKLNPVFMGLKGTMGEMVFKMYGDKVVMSKKPDMSKVKWSEKQLAAQARFREAMRYAKLMMADE